MQTFLLCFFLCFLLLFLLVIIVHNPGDCLFLCKKSIFYSALTLLIFFTGNDFYFDCPVKPRSKNACKKFLQPLRLLTENRVYRNRKYHFFIFRKVDIDRIQNASENTALLFQFLHETVFAHLKNHRRCVLFRKKIMRIYHNVHTAAEHLSFDFLLDTQNMPVRNWNCIFNMNAKQLPAIAGSYLLT